MYEYTGRVTEVCETQMFASGFAKRELVVEEEGRSAYPRHATFNFKKECLTLLDQLHVGDRVKVSFAVEGREWTDPRMNKVRHFTDLVGIGVTVLASEPAVSGSEGPEVHPLPPPAAALANPDPLPF